MVLYDKKSNFLGIGRSELSLLGFEDIEEFKSYHDDFADLFVNHPGYISKFKNFSWIDYTLHSGVSNKSVILRHKNGTEIEAKLDIMEIFLLDEISGESSIYNIDINVSTGKNDFTITNNPHLNQKNIKLEPVKEDFEINQDTFQTDSQKSPIAETTPEVEKLNFDDFAIEDYEEDEQTLKNETGVTDSFEKIPENEDYIEKEEDFILNEKPKETTIKLKVDMSDDILDKKYEPQDDTLSDDETETIIQKDDVETKKEISKNDELDIDDDELDFTQIAEDTGMDIEDLAMFIDEFIKESKNASAKLSEEENQSDIKLLKDEILQLKGIVSNLKMKNFVKMLNLMFENCGTQEFEHYLNKFDSMVKNLENQLS